MRAVTVFVMGLFACGAPATGRAIQAEGGTPTVVSLSFDDTFADQFQVAAMVGARGLHATFFLNSGRVNLAGSMSQGQLLVIQEAGNELAGHTVSHADLPTLEVDEQRRQICNDRVALLGFGFDVRSFAYPFGDSNATTEQIVADCGYNSARGVGDLVSPGSCVGCAFANPIPPTDAYNLKTPDSIKVDTTLDTLEGYVTQAEDNGGGWVPLVFHHVCDGCDPLSVSPATLGAFLDWLAARADSGTVVQTIGEVIGGPLQPGVPGPPPDPPPPAGNLLQNPSLELDGNGDGIPDCWQRGGSGTNTSTFTLTSDAADGAVAQRIDVTSFTSGARRLVSRQDLGSCAPAIFPGHSYTVTASYHATTPPRFTVYYRTSSGGWVWFAQSPLLPVSDGYVTGTYTTPALPAVATAISAGLSIYDVGSITMDAFVLSDADTTPPAVSIDQPGDGATVAGVVTLSATASDAGGVDHVDFLVDGSVVGTARGPFAIAWDSTTVADAVVGLTARAVDLAGNTSLSTSRLITIANAPPLDTTPPVVALTAPGDGTLGHGTLALIATASDDTAVDHVDFLVDDLLVGSADAPPYQVAWDSSHTGDGRVAITARATDTSGNATVSAPAHVTIDNTAPTVSITAPADGATLAGVVAVAVDASDGVVELFVSGTSIGAVASPPYQLAWDTTAVSDGPHALTAVATDAAGNQTTAGISVTLANGGGPDTTPPVTTITCDGATCGTGFANHPVTVALAATDAGGVAAIRFTLDGTIPDLANGTTYTTPLTIAATATITFRAFDLAGNAEAPRAVVVRIDTVAPVTEVICDGAPCKTGFYPGPVTVELDATDADSGVAAIRYSLDGSEPSLTYTDPISVGVTATLRVSAVDGAGNAEPVQVVPIAIDAAVPTVAVACNGTACAAGFYNQPIAITLSATAGVSGVAAIRYTLDGSTPTATTGLVYTGPFALSATATLHYLAVSGAGVASPVASQLVQIDTVPPTASVGTPANGASVTGIAPINAIVSDDVGVIRVRFYLDGKQLGTRVVTPFKWNWDTSTTTPGVHAIAVQAEDAAGNATRSASITVTVH
jgi:peptidoglycan/xylan/chitin deacetylase (PgdA/CDA1 family)